MSAPDTINLSTIPSLPGVYRFVDKNQNPLYVGKALNLKKRVASYYNKSNRSPRIQLMLAKTNNVEITVTASEHAALLLENTLIKSLRPRYNIVFRDDKSYPCLRLTKHAYPRLMFARGEAKDEVSYGPFPDSHAVKETINLIQKVFRLRTCVDSVMANRSRPCLLHSIERCSAPCVNIISPAQYAADISGAKALLSGNAVVAEANLRHNMQEAADKEEFEKAASFRDRLRALAIMRTQHGIEALNIPDTDYIGAAIHNRDVCVNVLMVRGKKRIGERRFFSEIANKINGDDIGEILSAFISQHYSQMPKPPPVIIPCQRIAASPIAGVICAPRGENKHRAEEAAQNALIALQMKQSKKHSSQTKMNILAERLNIPPPRQIECFDISHSSGESPMAARVVFIDGAPATAHYRRYAIRGKGGGDTAAIGEAVTRCYQRVITEATTPPDLLLIDGGAGQLNAARRAMPPTLSPCIIAITKAPGRKAGEEKIITVEGEVLYLADTDPAFHLLQAARDEAHRFAVSGHRRVRDKKRNISQLEQIEGVGANLRKILISHFGGLQTLRATSEAELVKIKGIGPHLAKRIYDFLHQ